MPLFGAAADVNRRRSLDSSAPAPIAGRCNLRLVTNLTRPRSSSGHNLPPPLNGPPSQPSSQYQRDLRYHSKETARVVMQEQVDRKTQSNLSRNAREVLTGDKSFWDDSDTDAKGRLGLGPQATTLKKLTLHRRRMDLIDHPTIGNSRNRLNDIANAERRRLMLRECTPLLQQQAESDATEFGVLMTAARRDADDVLAVLDFQIETLQSRQTRGEANDADRATLQRLRTHRNNIAQLVKLAFAKPSGVNNFGVYDHARTRLARLDAYLQTELKPDWRGENLPASLGTLSHLQALRAAAKLQVQTLSSADQARVEKSRHLQAWGNVLATAVDEKRLAVSVRDLYGKKLVHSSIDAKPGAARDAQLREQQQALNSNIESFDDQIASYARILESARKNGVKLIDLDLRPNESCADHLARISQGHNSGFLKQIFNKVDQRLRELRDEHRVLAKELRPQNKLQKAWGWLRAKFQTRFRRTATEMDAFSTEFGLANKEAQEAALVARHIEEPPDPDAPEITTPAFVAKDTLHALAVIKNADDRARIREERAHLQHKMHESREKLEEYDNDRGGMSPTDKYRSQVVRALYEKTGDQSLALTYLEEAVADTQIARHLTTVVHDVLAKSGIVGQAVKYTGAVGLAGAAVAETAEGFIGAGRAINAQMIKNQLESQISEIQQQIKTTNDPEVLESLKFQERTLQDLSDQQERLTRVMSSLKGFGMGAGYTLSLLAVLGAASTGVAAPVLLAVFAGTQVGLAAYKSAKASHASWKIDRTDDLLLNRGGSKAFLDTLLKEAREQGATPEQVALTRICRGKGPDAKRASSRKLLRDLKWETGEARLSDRDAADLTNLQEQVDWRRKELANAKLDMTTAEGLSGELRKLEQQLRGLVSLHTSEVMKSPSAQTLRDAYGMSEAEIVAMVDAPNDDRHDEFGVRLINEYQNALTD